eukprot:UN13176
MGKTAVDKEDMYKYLLTDDLKMEYCIAQEKNCVLWDNDKACDWLLYLDKTWYHYRKFFQAKNIQGKDILNFNENEILALGIKNPDHIDLIVNEVEAIKNRHLVRP